MTNLKFHISNVKFEISYFKWQIWNFKSADTNINASRDMAQKMRGNIIGGGLYTVKKDGIKNTSPWQDILEQWLLLL